MGSDERRVVMPNEVKIFSMELCGAPFRSHHSVVREQV